MFSLFLLAVVFAPMLIEAVRARTNEARQRAGGGIEASHDVYAVMRVAYPAAFLAMIAEGAVRGQPASACFAVGVGIFAAAKALKWWAILTLGSAWTFRVIVVPGAPLIGSGPYRFVRHPNYIAVLGELIGISLLAGAWLAGPIVTVGFGVLMLRRVHVEDRALGGRQPQYNDP